MSKNASLTAFIRNAKKCSTAIFMLFGFGLATAPSSVYAQASGGMDLDITVNPLILLYYYGNVDVTISTAALAGIVTGGTGDAAFDEGVSTVNAFTPDLAVAGTSSFTSPTAVNLDMTNAWAVRALGNGSNNVRVSVALTDNTLIHATSPTDQITVSSIGTRRTGVGAYAANVDFAPQGLGTRIFGDVRMTLDLSAATKSGVYNDAVVTITAASL